MDEKTIGSINLDFDNFYDSDGKVCVFAVIGDELIQYADKVRSDLGLVPFFYGENVDDCGTYDFYAKADETGILEFYFIPSTNQADDWKHYDIPLGAFRDALFVRLNELCNERFGKSVSELIAEGRA